MDKLPFSRPSELTDGYLQVPIVSQAFVAEVLGKFFAVSDRFRICLGSMPIGPASERRLSFRRKTFAWSRPYPLSLPCLCHGTFDYVPRTLLHCGQANVKGLGPTRFRLNRRSILIG